MEKWINSDGTCAQIHVNADAYINTHTQTHMLSVANEEYRNTRQYQATPARGRGTPGDRSKWLSHDELMKKEFMYRHQQWENRYDFVRVCVYI